MIMKAPIIRLHLITFLIHISHIQSHHDASSLIQLPQQTTLTVTDFGATGNGQDYDTESIQTTINACPPTKICHVIFPPGNYLTATIHLNKSNTILNIQKGATLLGGTNIEDYDSKEFSKWYVILAENVSNVGITGAGAVDGQGLQFVKRFSKVKNVMVSWNHTGACLGDECRPRLVGFLDSTNVHVWNVTFNQPAYWCLHIVRCQNTSIHDVSIYGDFDTPNNDGIDIEDSNNTVITRCHIDTGDDAICPKTYTGPLYNLTATNSWIRTKSSAIKFGSASWYDFKNLMFDNITIVDSHRGLGLQIRDGGDVSDVTFSNINISTRYYHPSWWGRAEPIYVTSCPRYSYTKEGSISNIRFINISATSENGVFLAGSKGGLIRNIKFINVNLTYRRWTEYSGGLIDYRPGCQGLINHGAAGIIMEHIKGIEIENVNMKWSDSENHTEQWDIPLDFRPWTVNNISFSNFHSGLFKH